MEAPMSTDTVQMPMVHNTQWATVYDGWMNSGSK
jgi:hypothetical protein